MTTIRRKQTDYIGLKRLISENHLKTEVTKARMRPPENKISQFFTKTLWSWLYHYIKSRFGRKHDYITYPANGDNGIYPLQDGDIIGIVSDWATDTDESCEIATKLQEQNPQFTIHAGDTYFVGEPKEIAANFLNDGCPWIRGSKGSFALLGNHEMYARGVSFFEDLLPTLGIFQDGTYQKQKAGFFCLENEHWRILGLDTGYHSVGKLPLVEMIPFLAPDCRFDEKLMDWLKNVIKLGDPNDKRGLVILTHHQYVTAFKREGEFQKPADQLASLIGKEREVIWLWGHEHKFSMFSKTQVKNGVTAYGRCIGHGGMPVELDNKTFSNNSKANGFGNLVMVDMRPKPNGLGFNGYIIAKVEGSDLLLQYRDSSQALIEEVWHHDPATGKISGRIKSDPGILKPLQGKSWADLYK